MQQNRTVLDKQASAHGFPWGFILLAVAAIGWILFMGGGVAAWAFVGMGFFFCTVCYVLGRKCGGFQQWALSHFGACALLLLGFCALDVTVCHFLKPHRDTGVVAEQQAVMYVFTILVLKAQSGRAARRAKGAGFPS